MKHAAFCAAETLAANIAFVTGRAAEEIERCPEPPVTLVQVRVRDVPGIVSVFLVEVCADHETFVRMSPYFARAHPIDT